MGGEPGGEALAAVARRRARRRRGRQAGPAGDGRGLLHGQGGDHAGVEDELDRGSGEPAVGPFQDAQVSRGHARHYTWRPMDPRTDPAGLLPLAKARSERALASLELLVNRDSGSYSADGVNRVADLCEERLRSGGWTVERVTPRPGAGEAQLGDLVIGRRQGARPVEAGGRRLLLMAHMDTVFDDGTAAARPFRVEGGRAYGPGVADDKCGLLARLAGEHEIGVGLEAARVNGALVTSRKGISALEIGIQGKAVHAGVRPKEGINAALEAARKAEALHALNDRWQGVTCNVGVIRAGTRPNVVAERAELQLDLRAVTAVDFERALAAVREIAATSYVPRTVSSLRIVHRHPPMERTEAVAGLLAEARRVAAALGFELREAASGGAGDANTTAAAGLPTIDGFGPVGGEAHGPAEWLDLDSVAPRTALLAGFLARVGAAAPPS